MVRNTDGDGVNTVSDVWNTTSPVRAGDRPALYNVDWASTHLLHRAMTFGEVLESRLLEGNLLTAIDDLVYRISKSVPLRHTGGDDGTSYWTFTSNDSIVSLSLHDGELTCKVHSVAAGIVGIIADIVSPAMSPSAEGAVYVLVSDRYNNRFMPRKMDCQGIVRANYSDGVLSAVDHLAEDMVAEKPCGRLVIFDGEPGTGKTHLVKGLIAECRGAVFAVVPPHMVKEFGSPDFIPTIIRFAERKDHKNVVFILEDADASILPRGVDNMNCISTLLNFTDGIMASTTNMRFLVTTNAHKLEIDPALLRPGRLCKHIHVGKLTPEHASTVYSRLTGGKQRVFKSVTLADVYSAARSDP